MIKKLILGVLSVSVLLSGCQPSDDAAAERTPNESSPPVDSRISSDDEMSTQAVTMDIAPSYVDHDVDDEQQPANRTSCQNEAIVSAFHAQLSDRQVKGCGTIIKALPDDTKGSRHQKILIALTDVNPEQTVLLVHNIDIAPRVADTSRGTPIYFYGEYVYNDKGGLVHWTHHDPAARHQHGWIESGGVRYD